MRRLPVLLFVVVLALATVQPAVGDRNGFRAAVSFWAMRHTFFDGRDQLYREVEGTQAPAHAWPYSQALAATIAMTAVPRRGRLYVEEAARRISALSSYATTNGTFASARGHSGDVYYDDNEWIALELVRWYRLHHARRTLTQAQRLFGAVVKAWDSNSSHTCPGGVFWTTERGNDDRNTVTTATGALLGLQLYGITRRPSQLRWAKQMLGWLTSCMLAPDGLLWDHLDGQGSVDESHWSYNQGTAIGANVLLYRLTGDRSALRRAEALADTSLAYFDRAPDGREPPYFLGIFFRNLLDLAAVDANPEYRADAQAYADAAWDAAHDPRTGLFRFRRGQPVQLLEQAAMVQLYATLASSR